MRACPGLPDGSVSEEAPACVHALACLTGGRVAAGAQPGEAAGVRHGLQSTQCNTAVSTLHQLLR